MQTPPRITEIRHPRRILCLGAPDSGVLSLLKDLTGSKPEPRSITSQNDHQDASADANTPQEPALTTTIAGTTHILPLVTKYYTATIPIWLDETTNSAAWEADFTADDATEVVRAVGAWLVVFRDDHGASSRENARALMGAVRAAIEAAHGGVGVWDGACLVVGMPPAMGPAATLRAPAGELTVTEVDAREEWEDACWDLGFEYVEGWIKGEKAEERNEAGEKRGIARLKEALEACEWDAMDHEGDDLGLSDDNGEDGMHSAAFGEETFGFGLERAQMESEFAGLKMAMADSAGDLLEDEHDADQGEQVEELERMMLRLQAVKDMSAGMPDRERKRLAAKTVNDIMKDI